MDPAVLRILSTWRRAGCSTSAARSSMFLGSVGREPAASTGGCGAAGSDFGEASPNMIAL